MTLKDLFDLMDKEYAGILVQNTFDLKLEMNYVTTAPYPYDDSEIEHNKEITEIEIDKENRTITFK
jgi:hypothetical protein